MFAQYKKELRSYFTGMTGVVFISLVLILTGIIATVYNFKGGDPMFEDTLTGVMFAFFLAVPILTMRSFAEERSAKTDQLLYSLPISMTKIVLGKYLAMLTVLGASVAVMATYPVILSFYGSVNFLSAYNALFAFFLLGASLISIGMFISTITESQVIAAVLSLGVVFAIWFMQILSTMIPSSPTASLICFFAVGVIISAVIHLSVKNSTFSGAALIILTAASVIPFLIKKELFEGLFPRILEQLALFDRIQIFTSLGIFDVSGVVYYLSAICLFVFFTVRSMEKRRWA